MVRVGLKKLEKFIHDAFCAAGVKEEYSVWMTDVFMRSTLRGVGHHDISHVPSRLESMKSGKINPKPEIKKLQGFKTMETYEGDNASGEICSTFVMERAKKLADEYGVGICTIINSNHFLAAAPYVEKASEEGYFSILYTRGHPIMGAPNRTEQTISACPMGFGAPTSKEYPIMMDICLAYASHGLLDAKMKAGESVPAYWGYDKDGNPSTDPAAIMDGGTRAPMGQHKGFGLSMMGEIFTGVLSGGQVIDEPHPKTGYVGKASQAAIVIKPDGIMPLDAFKAKTGEMIDRVEERAPGIHVPGYRSYESRKKLMSQGYISLEDKFVEKLDKWADELKIMRVTG